MTAQKGKDLLIKLDETGSGSFVTVAGLRASRIALNAETVDITTADSAGQWRELLAGAGVRSASLTGSGVFKDAAADAALRRVFFDAGLPEFQVVIPDFGTISGPFQLTGLDYAGEHDGAATYELSLVSAGLLSFAEAA
ncbi:phage major tail protein, TP901-1 family [Paralimibaculum aggregatum]|uniref:Phage major tail protein, TP901-1 family n=1 Tax=Paralimibaculum aggregatum TaxID=3036245 RepID=A0ABQ6LKB9_9RHOB|nr:phage major tail protein, TP901-1 family [Limibaculum sp. NKW23]GMG81233.1 phage major tail protein, TP901-1 family [Limibaculum sp. NKW23]